MQEVTKPERRVMGDLAFILIALAMFGLFWAMAKGCEETVMDWILLIVSLGLMAYLWVSLIRPEKF